MPHGEIWDEGEIPPGGLRSVAGKGLRQIVWVGGQGPKDIEGVRRAAGWANIIGKVLTSRGIPVEISFEIENE